MSQNKKKKKKKKKKKIKKKKKKKSNKVSIFSKRKGETACLLHFFQLDYNDIHQYEIAIINNERNNEWLNKRRIICDAVHSTLFTMFSSASLITNVLDTLNFSESKPTSNKTWSSTDSFNFSIFNFFKNSGQIGIY